MEYLSGNEALVRALKEAKISRATAYPGTPSTNILEGLRKISDIACSWSVNEKVALEDAAGVSFAGGRAVCIMKSVGLNVASDPFMTLSYTGVFGALVIIVCDDPGAYSSQNEQDNRNYAKFAKIPMLEPSSPQEAYDFLKEAIFISETFDTPVLYRMTTRVCVNKTAVDLKEFVIESPKPALKFPREIEKLVMTPRQAQIRRRFIEERSERLKDYHKKSKLHEHFPGKNKKRLLVTSGVSFLYAKELFPDDGLVKVGMTYPIPAEFIKDISKNYDEVVCIEELDPFMEELLLIEGVPNIRRKHKSFHCGDYTPRRVRQLVEKNEEEAFINAPNFLPPPPPTLCSGCPHITILTIIRSLGLDVCGDIGCYTIGSASPYYAMHAVVDMGASIPMSTGMKQVLGKEKGKKIAAIIGDSTFFHSGITGIVDAVQNKSNALVFILDNRATAMTGRQGHAGVGDNLLNSDSPKVDYVKLLEAVGVKNITILDPYNLKDCQKQIEEASQKEVMRVFILRRECALLLKKEAGVKKTIISDNCVNCRDCLRLGCPAIYFNEKTRKPSINLDECIGCEICIAACEFDAIVSVEEKKAIDERRELAQKDHDPS